MATQSQTQYIPISRSPKLAMNWTREGGCRQYRWTIAKQAKPYQPGWFEKVRNSGDVKQKTVRRGTQRLYCKLRSKLSWLIHLFR